MKPKNKINIPWILETTLACIVGAGVTIAAVLASGCTLEVDGYEGRDFNPEPGALHEICRDAVLAECYCRPNEGGCTQDEIVRMHAACVDGGDACWADFVDFDTQSFSCVDGREVC